jgi:hypothetical protein
MSPINAFLLRHELRLASNPCISPDFCLDWPALRDAFLRGETVKAYAKSRFETAAGSWTLLENEHGDCAWKLEGPGPAVETLADGARVEGGAIFPATFENVLRLKNLVQEHAPTTTVFPTADRRLGKSTLGIGARFTTLHWPAVDWAMSAIGLGVTANQNSIPRELVYDVDAMLAGQLDTVPFPFVGTSVPEGHQGQSVQGMSHGCILAKLKTGFHRRGVAWSFNADHQPIGGKFDAREDALVDGCLLATYITFDLSPELANRPEPLDATGWVAAHVPPEVVGAARTALLGRGLSIPEADFLKIVAHVWPAIEKMKRRDVKYTAARAKRFSTAVGRAYLRELSIDELPGITTAETTAVMLALCDALAMKIHFVAPAFGFQKNVPYADTAALQMLVARQYAVCRAFDVSLGFHSGSGKSAENYEVLGRVTGGRLEIKTSGRYTYEMGRALAASSQAADQALWRDWYGFTVDLAVAGAFSPDLTEQRMARTFVIDALAKAGHGSDVFASPDATRSALAALPPSPEHMFWFEYNFLFVLAAEGRSDKRALGDHSPAGYRQRARFYRISEEARLGYAKNVARYVLFLAEHTGLAPGARCAAATRLLDRYASLHEMLDAISH